MTDSSTSPILSLVNAKLHQQTGISAFGALVHLARLNHFHGPDFPTAFGLRFQYRDDLSKLLAFSAKRRAGLASAATTATSPPATWGVEPWQPFPGQEVWEHLPWSLRACASCLRFGYHSNLFQMPWIGRCPWHRTQLIDHCRKCGCPLLDGFRQGQDLMRCACGVDYVDELAVLNGDRAHAAERSAFVQDYLAWAEARRQSTTLLCPEEFDARGGEALSALVTAPMSLERWQQCFLKCPTHGVHLDRIDRRRSQHPLSEQDFRAMVRCANSLWPGQPGMAELPASFLAPLVGVTRQIAAPLPDTALTCRERDALALEPVTTPASTLSRHELMLLPVQRVANGLYLDVRVLHPTAYRVIGGLGWHLITNDTAREHPNSGSHRLLLTAIRRALGRAYADGFKHVLGRHVPAIYDQPRIKAGPRLPWAMLARDDVGALQIRIAWSVRRFWHEHEPHIRRPSSGRAP